MKKRLLPLIIAALLLCLLPVAARAEQTNTLTLSQTEALVYAPHSLALRATQAKGFREAVEWTSSDPQVATVSRSGSVRGVSEGSAVITAVTPSGASASCSVTVEVAARSVRVAAGETTLFAGLTGTQLTASVSPADTTNKTIVWTSSDPAVAAVDENGYVTPLSPGSVRITAMTASGAHERVKLHVRVPTSGISLNLTETIVFAGKNERLNARIEPSNAFDRHVTWTSSDPAVAEVSRSGSVRGMSEGTAVITATAAQGQTAQCVVHVQVGARSLDLKADTNTIFLGMDGVQMTAAVGPANTTDKTIAWSSSNPGVAAVDENGYVTPVSAGSVRITAATVNDIRRSMTVYVRVPAASVTLDQSELTVYAGKTERIRAAVAPSNTYDKRLRWTSSDPEVAVVNGEGKVTGRSEGSAVITATASSGVSASCVVRVEVGVRSVSLTAPDKAVYLGEGGLQLSAAVTPANATNKTITWTSSKPEVAVVDENGFVQAVSSGRTVITATAANGVKRTMEIRSYVPPASVTFDRAELTVAIKRDARLVADVQPASAFSRKVTWFTSDASIATVSSSGKVTGKKAGSCLIIARDERGHEASCTVHVEVPVASIALGAKSVTLVRGASMAPQFSVLPADATNTHLTMTSADSSVAAVNPDGTISGVRAGTTTVTLSSVNGRTAALSVKVVDPAESISVDQAAVTLSSGQSLQLNATVLPLSAGDRSVSWSASDPTVAVVTPDGRVIGHKEGVCVVTARANGGLNLTASCAVTVTGQPTKIVALTFDGVMSENSARVLNILNRYGVRATFFVVGDDATYTYRSVLLQMVASGMEIGNHTHTHPHLDRVSLSFALEDIRICDDIIEEITGKRPAIVRAPFGRTTSAVAAADKRPSFIWNVDSLDWKYQSVRSIYNRVVGGVKNMDVVLMHQTESVTAEALERILPKLIEEGYDFVTCSELYSMVGGVSAYPSSYFFLAVR
ncbi:MAG: Ig-like domain-containing protein [Clostridia bacterium]|nr:Ig-like domain-containing protein [Clostridia bacterium]